MSNPYETDTEPAEFEFEVPEILRWVLPCQGCSRCAPLMGTAEAHPRRSRSGTACRGTRSSRGRRRVAR
ncbi:hypothetical protein GPA19_19630 [Azoarcus indigens]|uniref:Uncharacterized protein n=1 Tax=Azoarcus indigens TaxID=29545 RepID=A0A4R6ECJ3_9RHOO|nr:hypothetical protein [Azoarcus indigens]NMG67156.1 hypothetical protein [Azoarcus indigens]TDN55877.1 hypothetical protein C7389_103215 [Azoarcus indigens]